MLKGQIKPVFDNLTFPSTVALGASSTSTTLSLPNLVQFTITCIGFFFLELQLE